MNFDKRAPKPAASAPVAYPKKFVSYQKLRALFDQSKLIPYDAERDDAITEAEKLLRPYNVSFGNRILKQIEDFVRAYTAASEIYTDADRDKFIREAVDRILLTKVVRKLEFKQVADFDALTEGFHDLKLFKCEEFTRGLQDTEL